jgi:hypothetical protein
MPSPTDQYEAALKRLVLDEEQARGSVETLRARMATAEAQIAKLVVAVDALLPFIPPERRREYEKRLAEIRPPARPNRGGTAYEAIVALVDRQPSREWTAPELQDALLGSGVVVEIEQVHNVLNYLTRKGRLTRTSRGRYMPVGMKRAVDRANEFAS